MSIPLAKPILTEEMVQAAMDALRNEKWTFGKSCALFEEEFRKYIGTDHAVAVNSGTSALSLSLIALGIRPGDEVIVPAMTFSATANAVVHTGARPVFVDIDSETWNIDVDKIPNYITGKTKAIIPVHLYGNPASMGRILDIARYFDLKVVEDCCQAHGAKVDGIRVGAWGDTGAFSFYPSKNMTVCGDGGMITTNDSAVFNKLRSLQHCGRAIGSRDTHNTAGYTARLNTMNAAIGRIQLKHLDEWNEKRRQAAAYYKQTMEKFVSLTYRDRDAFPTYQTQRVYIAHESVWHLFVIQVHGLYERDILKATLANAKIASAVHYRYPVHWQPVYRKLGYKWGDFPNAEEHSKKCLSLPMYPDITLDEVNRVLRVIKNEQET